jgi:hypothetical protein
MRDGKRDDRDRENRRLLKSNVFPISLKSLMSLWSLFPEAKHEFLIKGLDHENS